MIPFGRAADFSVVRSDPDLDVSYEVEKRPFRTTT